MSKKEKIIIGLTVIAIALIVIGGISYGVYRITTSIQKEEPIPQVPSTEEKTRNDLISFVNKFETYQNEKRAKEVLNLFTPPQTSEEQKEYGLLYMEDEGIYRLYSAAELTHQIESWSVEQIDKISDKRYQLKISEVRNLWDQVSGTWDKRDVKVFLTLIVVKKNNQWLIDKYYRDDTPAKYSGFSNI